MASPPRYTRYVRLGRVTESAGTRSLLSFAFTLGSLSPSRHNALMATEVMTPTQFVEKWKPVDLAKRAASQEHFIDLCRLLGQSAIMTAAAKDPRLKKRTLTNLYDERPTWLKVAHEKLDRAVLAAYAATDPEGAWSEDWAEVWRDTGAGQPLPEGHTLAGKRAEVDQKVLGNLLRLNR